MTTLFESELASYNNALQAYKDKSDQLKALAKLDPGSAAAKIGEEIATPLAAHLLTEGVTKLKGKIGQLGAKAVKAARGKISDTVNRQLGRNELTDLSGDTDEVSDLSGLLPDGAGEILGGATGNALPSLSAEDIAGLTLPSRPATTLGRVSDEVSDDPFGIRGLNDVVRTRPTEFFNEPEADPGQSSNMIGRLFSRGSDQVEQATSSVRGLASDATDAVTSRATALAGEGGEVTEGAAVGGAEAGAESAGIGAAEVGAVDTGLATSEAIADASGPETFGVGFVVGGLIAVGAALFSAFSAHKTHHTPNPGPPPNLSQPSFTVGLAQN